MEDRTDEMKKLKNIPPFPHLLQAQQAPALPYAKVIGRPGTGSYPAPSPDLTTHLKLLLVALKSHNILRKMSKYLSRMLTIIILTIPQQTNTGKTWFITKSQQENFFLLSVAGNIPAKFLWLDHNFKHGGENTMLLWCMLATCLLSVGNVLWNHHFPFSLPSLGGQSLAWFQCFKTFIKGWSGTECRCALCK